MLRAYKARWIFPVAAPPQSHSYVVVDGARIHSVGDPPPGVPVTDLGNVALIPALINAHTHLEFSALNKPLGRPGIRFPRWINRVVAYRRFGSTNGLSRAAYRAKCVAQGMSESCRAGIAAIGEIATQPWSPAPFEAYASSIRTTVFLELIGLRKERLALLTDQAQQHLAAGAEATAWQPGLSPHAPYSVHPDLVAKVAELSAATNTPVAMHLAETYHEIAMLERGQSGLVRYLYSLGLLRPRLFRGGRKILDYLEVLSGAARTLAIHGNYFNDEDFSLLARCRDRMSVVYCPRTHHYFQHARYPLARALEHGVRVALGTDSRASNPDLELMEDVRHVGLRFPEVPASEVLAMGTLRGAEALGIEQDYGSLEPGKLAALAKVSLPEYETDDPHELLWAGGPARRLELDNGSTSDWKVDND